MSARCGRDGRSFPWRGAEPNARAGSQGHTDRTSSSRAADGWLPVHADADAVAMHPDLAVLLSTSGTTGTPKLVRLSRRNLVANAEAIAGYLGVTPEDRAITLLPFHYSYGMSVLHIHLMRGAGIVLTEGA